MREKKVLTEDFLIKVQSQQVSSSSSSWRRLYNQSNKKLRVVLISNQPKIKLRSIFAGHHLPNVISKKSGKSRSPNFKIPLKLFHPLLFIHLHPFKSVTWIKSVPVLSIFNCFLISFNLVTAEIEVFEISLKNLQHRWQTIFALEIRSEREDSL